MVYGKLPTAKIEAGASGARFGVITQLAETLAVDPAELFTPQSARRTTPAIDAYGDYKLPSEPH